MKNPTLPGKGRKCTEQDSPYARFIGSTNLQRFAACNLFLHITISCYMGWSERMMAAETDRIRLPMHRTILYVRALFWKYYFSGVCSVNRVLTHHNIQQYDLFEITRKTKLRWKSRKYTEQDSSYAHCIGSTICGTFAACNLFLHIIISCT
jgi:hypothetical protein